VGIKAHDERDGNSAFEFFAARDWDRDWDRRLNWMRRDGARIRAYLKGERPRHPRSRIRTRRRTARTTTSRRARSPGSAGSADEEPAPARGHAR
jgi:hypothetical protein